MTIAKPYPTAAADGAARRAAPLALLFGLGALLVFVAAFAGPQALHDAAHDTRHGLAFPCH
jgi:cobalt transporter subunit CbtB